MGTREEWLLDCAGKLVDALLEPQGLGLNAETGKPLTDGLRVSCSWPSTRGLSVKKRIIGQCWPTTASADKSTEIFISPFLDKPEEVAATLLHELVHAAVGSAQKHNGVFGRSCRRVGLEGKPTATIAGEELLVVLKEDVLIDLGNYPHRKLDRTAIPGQTTRLLKAYCANTECDTMNTKGRGFCVRITQTWVDWCVNNSARLTCPGCGDKLALEGKSE